MKMNPKASNILLAALLAIAFSPAVVAETTAAEVEKQVSGLWYYTGLTTSSGQEMPLTGVFLFKDGIFVQQAIFNADDFNAAGSMSHAGPFQVYGTHVHLVADQTISTAPEREEPLSFRAKTEHDVTVARDGDMLRLQFGKGTSTIQDFEYVGPADGDLYALADGALAFVDDHFVLVQGNEDGIITGYGTFKKHQEDQVVLNVIRWTEGGPDGVTNSRDVKLKARFDGEKLTLPDGRVLEVAQ